MRRYDNYDYEEAFKKYIDDTEEERLEKLLKEGKVNCLYRTATTKCTNIKSQTTLLEAQIYPSYPRLSDMPKTKKRPSSKAQRNLNDKNARRYLIRIANINFGKGDLWCTFGWNNDKLPTDEERARKDIKNFIAKINYRRKRKGLGNIKYIYVLAFDGYVRPHFHILMTGDGMDRDELESLWKKCDRPNTRRISPDDDFLITGLGEYISRNPHGTKRWVSSRNLKKPPEPTKSYSKFKKRRVEKMAKDHTVLETELIKEYPGYKFLDAEVRYNGTNNGKRVVDKLYLICNPSDEAEYVDPCMYGEALTGGYVNKSFIDIEKIVDANCPKGKAAFTIAGYYTMGTTGVRVNEYDQTKAMENADLIIASCYANGRAVDDNVAVIFDVTKLEEYVLPVTQATIVQAGQE